MCFCYRPTSLNQKETTNCDIFPYYPLNCDDVRYMLSLYVLVKDRNWLLNISSLLYCSACTKGGATTYFIDTSYIHVSTQLQMSPTHRSSVLQHACHIMHASNSVMCSKYTNGIMPHKQNTTQYRVYYCCIYRYVYTVYTNNLALGYLALGHLAFKHKLIVTMSVITLKLLQ